MTLRRHAVVDTPLGRLLLGERDGRVAAVRIGGDAPPWFGARDDAALPELQQQLAGYFAGRLEAFDVPLSPVGTPFQQLVWAQLRAIPYGQTISYGELAARMGRPGAARAVGLANARNPLPVVVPCHRVVGRTGRLVGYSGGLPSKQWLLAHERSVVSADGRSG